MITLEQARNIVDEAPAHARRGDLPPMTVAVLDEAVLDEAARLVAFAREDIAQPEARGALNLGVGSRSLATRAATHPPLHRRGHRPRPRRPRSGPGRMTEGKRLSTPQTNHCCA